MNDLLAPFQFLCFAVNRFSSDPRIFNIRVSIGKTASLFFFLFGRDFDSFRGFEQFLQVSRHTIPPCSVKLDSSKPVARGGRPVRLGSYQALVTGNNQDLYRTLMHKQQSG